MIAMRTGSSALLFIAMLAWPPGAPNASATDSPYARVFYCVYQADDCISGDTPVALDRDATLALVERVLAREDNFIGFVDEADTTLQFYVDEAGKIWVEIPDVAERGSHGRHIDPTAVRSTIGDLSTPLSKYRERLGLEFRAW